MSDSERDSSSPATTPDPGDYAAEKSQTPEADASSAIKVVAEREGSPKGTAANTTPPRGGNPVKVTKRRAARACGQCRARKVRCDVMDRQPCNNCVLDNVPCTLQESRRRKKPFASFPHHPLRRNVVGFGVNMAPQPIGMANAVYGRHGSMPDIANGAGFQGVPFSQPLFPPHNSYVPPSGATGVANWNGQTFVPSPRHAQRPPPSPPADKPELLVPSYIKPLPANLDDDKKTYCHRVGAFLVPSQNLQHALLKAYVEFVHPYMPMLEIGDLLRIVSGREPETKISLLLYQAVMFVAVAFVDQQHLDEEGFASRKAARKELFNKVRTLYDFDIEADRLVTVQALLLMTYWYETPDDKKDTWHWMGIAISVAHTIGLHRNPASLGTLGERRQKLYKRIWWSMYMRDRLIALGMRRPSRIDEKNFDVPMLELSDFDLGPLPQDGLIQGDCRLIRDADMQRQLALMCIEKAKMCVLINRIIMLQYSVLARGGVQPDNTIDSTVMLMPTKNLDNFESVQGLDLELKQWHANLPACCRFQDLTESEVGDGRAPLVLHRTLLHMLYRATVAALHRPNFAPSPLVPDRILNLARERVTESAVMVITMASQLRGFRLDRYLPTTGVTAILPAMIMHIFEMRSPEPKMALDAAARFRQGMEVLGQLRQSYNSADFALRFLREAVERSNLGQAVFGRHVAPPHGDSNAFGMHGPMSGSAPAGPSLATEPLFLDPTDTEMNDGDNSGLLGGYYMAGAHQSGPLSGSTPPTVNWELPLHGTMSLGYGSSESHSRQQESATVCPNALQNSIDSDMSKFLHFPTEGVGEGVSGSDEVMMDLQGGDDSDWNRTWR